MVSCLPTIHLDVRTKPQECYSDSLGVAPPRIGPILDEWSPTRKLTDHSGRYVVFKEESLLKTAGPGLQGLISISTT